MAMNINVIHTSPRRCRNDSSDWGVLAATAVAGAACYVGYKIAEKKFDGKSASSLLPQQCAICWKKMSPRKHFNCEHSFHDKCILIRQTNELQLVPVNKRGMPIYPKCPICKADQVPDSEKDWEMVDEFDLH